MPASASPLKRWSCLLVSLSLLVLGAGCGSAEPAVTTEPDGTVTDQGARADDPVRPDHELIITDLRVVENPKLTRYVTDSKSMDGDWSFGRLVERMAGTHKPSQLVLDLLTSWERDQPLNGFVAPARPAIRQQVINPWMRASGCAAGTEATCTLDFTKAPFRLLAIVYRPDLRKQVQGRYKAGEGRFVWGVLDSAGNPLEFTVIFEYELPAADDKETYKWAKDFHKLSKYEFDAIYMEYLWYNTEGFTKRDAMPSSPNGSALSQLRTNEIALDPTGTFLWELREFRISGTTGLLTPVSVKQTPDFSLNGTSALADWVNANANAIKQGKHEVPESLMGHATPVPFQTPWSLPGVDEETRQAFALNTCNGCHHTATGTMFVQVSTRKQGVASTLSNFLAQQDMPFRVNDLQKLLLSMAPTSVQSTETDLPPPPPSDLPPARPH